MTRIVIAMFALVATGFAQADSPSGNAHGVSLVPPGGHVFIPRQDCWVEHTQVQPARLAETTAAGAQGEEGVGAWARTGKFAGSEHWTAELRRACKSSPKTGMPSSNVSNDFARQ